MKAAKIALVCLLVAVGSLATGCKQDLKVIDKVTFKPSDNLETIRVSLVFANRIKTDLQGAFQIKDYGSIFANPFTETSPFEIGFDLNTAVMNDQDYVNVTPTTVFPNGVAIGLDHAVVEVKAENPISSKFDIYGYVDILRRNWLGVAGMLNFLDGYFPADLMINQVFKRDHQGNPEIFAAVFGPTVNDSGEVLRAGGLSVFANVRALINGGKLVPGKTLSFKATESVTLSGKNAKKYDSYKKLLKVQDRLIQGLNRH